MSVLWNDDFRRIITRAAVPILALALKIKVLKVLKDGGVKSWVALSRCYCCLISLGMVKQQNEIKRQMFIEHIARFDKR